MAKRPKPGIGRGLEAILSVSKETEREREQELRELPIELIAPNARQPRRHFDEDALQALADSLGVRGILQPVLVRPVAGGTYELVAGERRWRAAQIAGLERVPALIRARDDAEAIELALIENVAREDLEPDRGGARLRCAGRGARPHARGGRPPDRAQPRRREQPAAPARPARRGRRAARSRAR